MNLRMLGLAAVVVVAALVPLVASAGQAGGPVPAAGAGSAPVGDVKGGSGADAAGLLPGLATSGTTDAGNAAAVDGPGGESDGVRRAAPRTASRCGPEVASPEGIEAQTCVLTRDGQTWARTYYRNATGMELTSVLTLMGPGGRTLQTNCKVEAGDEPRTCETPREPSRGTASAYWAVAEFAASGGTGDEPLLLRSVSNSRDYGGR
ncbi:hypothetical protein ACIQ7Q_05740 [Streptomyces sp. NPDC096176]|uniref:hypothetical protein n=1 Tax=Streptomyces sp. NPDC096176 TaxID=3366079 RepID=UPI003815A0A1